MKGGDSTDDWKKTKKEYDTSAVAKIADKLLKCVSDLADDADIQTVKQLVALLKDLRDIKEFSSELALRKAKFRKYERESAEENGLGEIKVVFEAGEEEWNE